LCEVDISSGVQAGGLRVLLSEALASCFVVALVTGTGHNVDQLVEHGEPLLPFAATDTEGKGAHSDVGVRGLKIRAPAASRGHEGHNSTPLGRGPACITGSNASLTAHDRPSPGLLEQEVHGTLVSDLDVLVVLSSTCTEPLLEEGGIPPRVGSFDHSFSSGDRVQDVSLLGFSALMVSSACDSGERVIEPHGLHAWAASRKVDRSELFPD